MIKYMLSTSKHWVQSPAPEETGGEQECDLVSEYLISLSEASTTKPKQMVINILIKEIIPSFRLPTYLQSGSNPAFLYRASIRFFPFPGCYTPI